jgi:hypothetical protein
MKSLCPLFAVSLLCAALFACNDSNVSKSPLTSVEKGETTSKTAAPEPAEPAAAPTATDKAEKIEKAAPVMPDNSKPDEKEEKKDTPQASTSDNTTEKEAAPSESEGGSELVETGGLQITELTMARGIEKQGKTRNPVGPGTSFAMNGERVYAFMRIENPAEEEAQLAVTWTAPGSEKERGKTFVTVNPQKTWTTWAFNKHLKKPGMWTVTIRNADETILARSRFEITEN